MDRLNLKDPKVQRRFVGRHLDEMIAAASQAGCACHVVYNDCPDVPPKNDREVVVHVDDVTNLVTRIR